MKKIFTLSAFCFLFAISGFSQMKKYTTSGLEIIFSQAGISDTKNSDASSTLRFDPIINIQSMMNLDMGPQLGFFTGLAIRNVGYIYDNYSTVLPEGVTTPIKKKFRTYSLGIPVGIKVGNLNGLFLYGGYEIEFPYVYKEKTWNTAGDKDHTDIYWFSNRTQKVEQSWLVGIQFPYGMNLKFKYYFTEFHNQNYDSNGVKPYAGLNAKVWYISLTTNLFKNASFAAGQK
jgi:hypothetical protein